MPPKVVFHCRSEKKDVPLTEYDIVRFSNGTVAAKAKCPSCGKNLMQIRPKSGYTAAEIAKLPLHKSKTPKGKTPKGKKSKTPKSKTGGSRRTASKGGRKRM